MIKKKPKRTTNGKILLSNAWQNKNLIDENTIILTDKTILENSRGLFNKRMTGESFMNMLERNTILDDARCQYLATGTVQINEIPVNSVIRSIFFEHTRKRMDLSGKIYRVDFYAPTVTVPDHLEEWITQTALNQIYQASYLKAFKSFPRHVDSKGTYVVPYENSIRQLHTLLENNISRIELHNGHAGCGKSTAIADKINHAQVEHKLIVSLSNTIGNMFKQKCPGITAMSCTAAAFRFANKKNEPKGYDIVVIDEFSQWGFEWIDLLIKLLAANPHAKFYIMGDIDQIPTFLSSGSIQYSMMKEFPNCVVQHDIQYRFRTNPGYHDMITNLQKGIVPPNTFFKGFNSVLLKNADVIITGTNDHVKEYNLKMLAAQTGLICPPNTDLSLMVAKDVPVICNKTGTVGNSKVFRNTKYTVIDISPTGSHFVLESQVDHSHITVLTADLNYNFDLGYAMTVNRAQGLEWDNVIVYMDASDKNLKTFNAMYVACSRGKNSILITSDDAAKCITEFSGILNKKYTFTNMFEEIYNEQ